MRGRAAPTHPGIYRVPPPPPDQTQPFEMTPGFKPFTILLRLFSGEIITFSEKIEKPAKRLQPGAAKDKSHRNKRSVPPPF